VPGDERTEGGSIQALKLIRLACTLAYKAGLLYRHLGDNTIGLFKCDTLNIMLLVSIRSATEGL